MGQCGVAVMRVWLCTWGVCESEGECLPGSVPSTGDIVGNKTKDPVLGGADILVGVRCRGHLGSVWSLTGSAGDQGA